MLTTSDPLAEFRHEDTPIRLKLFGDADHISRYIRENGAFYEFDVLRGIALFDFQDALAVDAGSNIGNHTVFFAKILGLRTLSVEPNAAAYGILRENVALNGLEARVEPVAAPLWSGAVRGRLADEDATNHGRARFVEADDGPIETTTIDALAGARRVALLKVDVEGAELEVIKGALATIGRDRPLVVVECIGLEDRRAIDALLYPLGYLRIGRAGATPTYFYATPERALNVALAAGFNASQALYQLNPGAYLASVERKESKLLASKLAKLGTDLTQSRRDNALLHAELDRLRETLETAQIEKLRLSQEARTLETKLEHQKYRRDLLDKKLKSLFQSRDRALRTRMLRLARTLSGGRVSRPMSYSEYSRDHSKRSNAKWRQLQHRPFQSPGQTLIGFDETVMRSGKVVVFLATYPAREKNLAQVVASLLPQCDVLSIYLNEYEYVPDYLKDKKIHITMGRDAAGNLKDNGKFFNVADYAEGFHIFVDDDIRYPPDYVERLIGGIRHFGYRAIVGFHGTIYETPLGSYVRDRTVLPFYGACPSTFVDQLGTGTTGYHTSTFTVDFSAFETTGLADLWFAKNAAERGVPLVALERPGDWLRGMEEVGDTLFRQVQRGDARETALLREQLAPALRARPRLKLLEFLRSVYTRSHLAALGLDPDASASGAFGSGAAARRSDVHFAVIINGWNCAYHVDACLASLEQQIPGGYTLDLHIYDDGSDDGTWEAVCAQSGKFNLHKFRGEDNMGPAFARDFLIRQVEDGDAICVLLDMDDRLLPHALAELEGAYLGNPDCWMTYGNWINQNGTINAEGFYAADEIDKRAYRSSDKFKFTHLRSFRRFLYDRVGTDHLKDEEGNWLRYCSDVGLMLPIADQCASHNVVALRKPVYLYNQYLPTGTQKRFGSEKKKQTFRYLRGNRDLFRFSE